MIADRVQKWTITGLSVLASVVFFTGCAVYDVADELCQFWFYTLVVFGLLTRTLEHFGRFRITVSGPFVFWLTVSWALG